MGGALPGRAKGYACPLTPLPPQDGEYDSRRAEAANDAGVAHSGAERWAQAHEAFTEAVRLSPDRPAYHANRASAALRLGNAAGAAEDAEHAVRLAPDHLVARLRAGKARLQLREAEVRPPHPSNQRGAHPLHRKHCSTSRRR